MSKKKKERQYLPDKLKLKILREYKKAPKGKKGQILKKYGIAASHIFYWKQQLGMR